MSRPAPDRKCFVMSDPSGPIPSPEQPLRSPWRVAVWIANYAFVAVTGDLRRDLFRHLTGHSQGYFADRMPGTLTSRVTSTSNAVFTSENMFFWNVMPPCAATTPMRTFGLESPGCG